MAGTADRSVQLQDGNCILIAKNMTPFREKGSGSVDLPSLCQAEEAGGLERG